MSRALYPIQALRDAFPHARFVLTLRDPLDGLRSNILMKLRQCVGGEWRSAAGFTTSEETLRARLNDTEWQIQVRTPLGSHSSLYRLPSAPCVSRAGGSQLSSSVAS